MLLEMPGRRESITYASHGPHLGDLVQRTQVMDL